MVKWTLNIIQFDLIEAPDHLFKEPDMHKLQNKLWCYFGPLLRTNCKNVTKFWWLVKTFKCKNEMIVIRGPNLQANMNVPCQQYVLHHTEFYWQIGVVDVLRFILFGCNASCISRGFLCILWHGSDCQFIYIFDLDVSVGFCQVQMYNKRKLRENT